MHFETARQQMIYHQIRPWDVTDKELLKTLATVQREQFVPEKYKSLAFADTAIPLPCGQHMLKPVVEGRLLQHLNVRTGDRVLVVGTGSGFTTACIAQTADRVTSIDIHESLVERASLKMAEEKIRNVELLSQDYSTFSPPTKYDRILVTGSMSNFDKRLPEWLKADGKLVLIVGDAPAMEAELVVRNDNYYSRQQLFETVVGRLENSHCDEAFHF